MSAKKSLVTEKTLNEAVDAILQGVEGMFKEQNQSLGKNFGNIEKRFTKIETELSFIKNDIKDLKNDTPSIAEFNKLKSLVQQNF